MSQDEDHPLLGRKLVEGLVDFAADFFVQGGFFRVGSGRVCPHIHHLLSVQGMRFPDLVPPQGVYAGVDADPVQPAVEIHAFCRAVLVKNMIGLDESILEDVFGILGILEIMEGDGKDLLLVFLEEGPEGQRVAFLGQPDQTYFVHVFSIYIKTDRKALPLTGIFCSKWRKNGEREKALRDLIIFTSYFFGVGMAMSITFTDPSEERGLSKSSFFADHQDLDLVRLEVFLGHPQDIGLGDLLDARLLLFGEIERIAEIGVGQHPVDDLGLALEVEDIGIEVPVLGLGQLFVAHFLLHDPLDLLEHEVDGVDRGLRFGLGAAAKSAGINIAGAVAPQTL